MAMKYTWELGKGCGGDIDIGSAKAREYCTDMLV